MGIEDAISEAALFSTDYKPFGVLYGSYGSVAFEYTNKPVDEASQKGIGGVIDGYYGYYDNGDLASQGIFDFGWNFVSWAF